MIDFHSHILHKIDDGSHNIEESIEMLLQSYAQGVDTIVLTSHFRLGEHNINTYLQERQARFEEICEALTDAEKKRIPKMILGAEVEYIPGMNKWDYLDKLTIKGTNYIMTEMPFTPWTESVVKTIDDIALNSPLTPILPHIDRYFHTFTKESFIEHYYKMPVIVQMNAIYINGVGNIPYFKHLLEDGSIDILGSDCHGTEWRPPNLGSAVKVIRELCGQKVLDEIDARGRKILTGAVVEKI